MTPKPLFVPLKAEYYRAFECGMKTTEYRLYGPRWNERTCRPGRRVVLSLGYGKRERLRGTVVAFFAEPLTCLETPVSRELYALYPGAEWNTKIACITVSLDAVDPQVSNQQRLSTRENSSSDGVGSEPR